MAETSPRYTGGCLCGALRFEAIGEPRFMAHCYCRDCRRASGSGFVPVMAFAQANVKLMGESRAIVTKAIHGGDATRNFCPNCGSLVFGGERDRSEGINIYAGSRDDPALFHPTVAIFASRRPDWAPLPPGVQAFDEMPG